MIEQNITFLPYEPDIIGISAKINDKIKEIAIESFKGNF
jgi:hypothetical protein